MQDTARAYFDTVFSLAGDSGRRARDFADKVRDDLRDGAGRFRSDLRTGTEQFRDQSSRTLSDIGRLVRAEVDAGLTRLGLATQADFDDLNLRLEHTEEEVRELRMRLAEATAAPPTRGPETADGPTDEEQA
ncbi:hypothetical protein GCM10027447_22970 [Glycomyces halotolerans]